MRLLSCGNCGTVLDQDRLVTPSVYREDGTVIHDNACWDGDEYCPVIDCPTCGTEIFYHTGERTNR